MTEKLILQIGLLLLLVLDFSFGNVSKNAERRGRYLLRLSRSLPSVSDDHFQELTPDGSYRYAYTGENSYHAERRTPDGTVEGETLYVRPDGVPIKVHYFANAKTGYRPTTEILYSERIRSNQNQAILLSAPASTLTLPIVEHVNPKIEGNSISVRSGSVGSVDNVAISNPSVTAIVGPGGHAVLQPESVAITRSGSNGISISSPTTTAIVGPGGTLQVAPLSTAATSGDLPVRRINSYHRHIWTPIDEPANKYVTSISTPELISRNPKVLIVPANPSYEYAYGYTAPDSKHPFRDSSAYVNVRVNQ